MVEKQLGIFTEEDINAINANIKVEKNVDVAKRGSGAAAGLAMPFWVGGGAVAAGGFAAAGV